MTQAMQVLTNFSSAPDGMTVHADQPESWAEVIRFAWGSSVKGIIETGRLLAQAKAALEHGQWGILCEDMLPFSQNTAGKLMQIAAHERLSNSEHVTNLPPHWGTLVSLAQLDNETFDKAVEQGVITPTMERRAAQRLARAGTVEAFLSPAPKPEKNDDEPEEVALDEAATMVRKLMRITVPVSDLSAEALAMIEAVATVTRCATEALWRADSMSGLDRWRATTARRLAIYMLHTECGMSQPEACKPFGIEPSSASYIAKGYEDFRDEPSFERMIERIQQAYVAYVEYGSVI